MKKPSDDLLWIAKNWPIHGIKVTWEGTSIEPVSYVTLASPVGTRKMAADDFADLCTLQLDFNSICFLKPHHVIRANEWSDYEKANAVDLAEYERLKEKFGK